MKIKLATACALSVITLAQAANAQLVNDQRWPRWYVGLSGGVTFLRDTDISGAETGKTKYQTGGIGTVALGYQPGMTFWPLSGMRLEAEFGYHSNRVDKSVIGGVATPGSGSLHAFSYMGNIYYDLRNSSGITPYIGAGAGAASVTLSKNSGLGNTSDGRNVFAYQFMGGIGYAPRSLPMTEWTLGYRYFVMNSPDFNTAGGKIKLDDPKAHTAEIGAKFKF